MATLEEALLAHLMQEEPEPRAAGTVADMGQDPWLWCQLAKPLVRSAYGTRAKLTPFLPYPFQADLMRAIWRGESIVVNKARQIGITETIAIGIAHRASHRPYEDWYMVSLRFAEATDLIERVIRALQTTAPADPSQAGLVTKSTIGKERATTFHEVRLSNGSRIIALGATPTPCRGRTASGVFLDEFAYSPWQDRAWQSAAGALGTTGQMVVASTPHGKHNRFADVCHNPPPEWLYRRLPWTVFPPYQAMPEFPTWCRRQRGLTEAQFAQEYGCDFSAGVGLVYPDFLRQVHVKPFDWSTEGGRWYRCWDWGFDPAPLCCVFVHRSVGDRFHVTKEYVVRRTTARTAAPAVIRLTEAAGIESPVDYGDPSGSRDIAEVGQYGIHVRPGKADVEQRIQTMHLLLEPRDDGTPSLLIDPSCTSTIEELESWAYEERVDATGRPSPVRANNHCLDAIGYMLSREYAGGRGLVVKFA